MNYRHIYHAGNFADVLKHSVLALAVEHLKLKPAPFRVIDTHAGIGRYDLASEQAQKTGEWHDGIGRLIGRDDVPENVEAVLAPYLGAVRAEGPDSADLKVYPGSPLIARRLMRRGDSLVVNELHPEDFASLKQLFAGDPQTKVLNLDGWAALKSLLPPKERRGIVLVDPPFEQSGEFQRLALGLRDAHKRFATGTVMLWYPIKDASITRRFHETLSQLGIAKLLAAELFIREPVNSDILNGTGLVVFNPPFTLHDKLAVALPFLAERLALGRHPSHRLAWISA